MAGDTLEERLRLLFDFVELTIAGCVDEGIRWFGKVFAGPEDTT
jgi:hypothetical protein